MDRARSGTPLSRLPGYRYGLAVAAVAAATLLFLPGRDFFAKGQWGLLYLLVTAAVAYATDARGALTAGAPAGRAPPPHARGALTAAVLSFLAWDFFFLPPYGEFALADPKDIVTLFVFLAIAIVIGLRTAGLRRSEAAAREREREARALGGLATGLLSAELTETMTSLVLDAVDEIFEPREAAVFTTGEHGNGQVWRRGDEGVRAAVTRAVALGVPDARQVALPEPGGRGLLVPLASSGATFGALYVGPCPASVLPRDVEALARSVAAVAAAFLEQQRLRSTLARAKVEQEADRLRAAIVSSVSHELKTPLASATTAVTGLLLGAAADDPDRVRSELQAVTIDLERLEASIGDLLDVSRLESRSWRADMETYGPGEIIGQVLEGLPAQQAGRIDLDVPEALPDLAVDLRQMVRALRNIVDNALAYAPDGRVVIEARPGDGTVVIAVRDAGPGVPEADRVMVFEKAFRGVASGQGTGMGLAIAKEIVALHGGRIWIEGVEPHGSRVIMQLPLERP
jgi:two-component system sensor histidine kinase KdpD